MNDAEIRAVLVTARSKIADGWVQGAGKTPAGVCAAQAIAEAMSEDVDYDTILQTRRSQDFAKASALILSIANKPLRSPHPYGYGYQSIPQWNDAYTTTKKMVLAVFDEAIRRLGEVEEPAPVPVVQEKVYVPREWTQIVIPVETPVEATTTWSKIKALVGV